MTYERTRRLVLAAGLGVLLLIAAMLYVRRVDTVEIFAVLLFIPVFLGFLIWRVPGGVVAGALAGVAYTLARLPAIDAVGASSFTSLIVFRCIAYLAFGAIGGWAVRQLDRSLTKLDLYDQIDDATGLYNARFFLQSTDLEMSRATRYRTLFSVAVVDVPSEALDNLDRKVRAVVLRDLGRVLRDSVRTVDRAIHGADHRHRFAVVCPETGPEGARVFTDRLADRLAAFLTQRGVRLADDALASQAITFPGDDGALTALRDEFSLLERAEHPEHPEQVRPAPPERPGAESAR